MARHLILGGGGFVGRHVARALLDAGQAVTVCARNPDHALESLNRLPQLRIVAFDILDVEWMDVLADVDVIHHYAWSTIPSTAAANPLSDVDRHVRPTIALLEACGQLGGKRLLFLSSGGTVYGRINDGVASEQDMPRPVTVYGATKLAVENYLRVYHMSQGVDCRVARLSNPYGLGQNLTRNQGLVSTFVANAIAGRPLEVWGDGSVVRDYIHVSDVARALVALATCTLEPTGDLPVFNVGSGKGASVNDVIAIIETKLAAKVEVRRNPGRAIDLPVSVLDISKARETLGWSPELSLQEGIGLLIDELQGTGSSHRI